MKTYGLVGRNISYSFSRDYFNEKFKNEYINAEYVNFDLESLNQFSKIVKETTNLSGLNVTIPYKVEIIPFLDFVDPIAKEIGAVNTIQFKNDEHTGYNTDYYGFMEALKPHLTPAHSHALILGTGGASKAVAFGLKKLGIEYSFVSRTGKNKGYTYNQLQKEQLQKHTLLINCTPLGTYPKRSDYPAVPTQFLTPKHLVFDLIYNPPVTRLLELADQQGAKIVNGSEMLVFQAEKAWEIWNS